MSYFVKKPFPCSNDELHIARTSTTLKDGKRKRDNDIGDFLARIIWYEKNLKLLYRSFNEEKIVVQ